MSDINAPTRRQRWARGRRLRRERRRIWVGKHGPGMLRVGIFLLGVAAMTRGVALWSIAAAYVFAGLSVCVVAVLLEREAMSKAKPKDGTA